MREAIENSGLAADVFVEISDFDRKPFSQPFPDGEPAVKSLTALKRLVESCVSSARLDANERSHRAKPEPVTQGGASANRYAIKIFVARKGARIELCRNRQAQIVGQLIKATKS